MANSKMVSAFVLGFVAAFSIVAAGCAHLPIVGSASGSCVLYGEKFTHIESVRAEFRTVSVPVRVLDTHEVERLELGKAPESTPDYSRFYGGDFYVCVIKKDDWKEIRDKKLKKLKIWDETMATTPRGQSIKVVGYDIDHWAIKGGGFSSGLPMWK